jgi:hypothetical protein
LAAQQQVEPQRLLFVFLRTSLPEDHDDQEARDFHARRGGQLQPLMCVDKALEELGDFADLVAESEQMEQDWHIVLVACMSGSNGMAPSAEHIEQALNRMLHSVHSGGDLSRYMAFDRDGTPLQFT